MYRKGKKPSDPKHIEKMKEKMMEFQLTYPEMGQLMGISKHTVHQYLGGYRTLTPERFESFMRCVGSLKSEYKKINDLFKED